VGVLVRQLRELDLSADQRKQVRQLIVQARQSEHAAASHSQLDLTVLGDPGSAGYARAVHALERRVAERISRESTLASRIYQVLTPEQRRNLATLLAADNIKMQHRREQMQLMRQRMQQHRMQGPPPVPPASSDSSGAPS
jgi:Spy/CpxP family protein refolding chaperone